MTILLLILSMVIPVWGPGSCGVPTGRALGDGTWSMNFTVASQGDGTNSPSVAMADGVLHCVFVNDGAFHTRSLDNGAHWGQPVQLSASGTKNSLTPSIAAEGSDVYVIWNQEKGSSATHTMWFSKSNDSGVSFTDPVELTGSSGHWSTDGRIMAQDGALFVVWAYTETFSNQEVYIKRSTDKGETWGNDVRMTNAEWPSFHVSIGTYGNKVHLVWEDERDPFGGSHKIFYKRSNDGGDTWTADTRITQLGIDVIEPSMAVVGDTVHVVWSREPYNIEYVRSDDGGLTWGSIRTIAGGDTTHRHEPFIEAYDDLVQVVWNENGNITYLNSTDGGVTFGSTVQLAEETPYVFYEWGYEPIDADGNGTYFVYSWDDREIRFRYKGELSDLSISPSEIYTSESYGMDGKTYINITVTVRNIGLRDALGATLELYLDSQQDKDRFEEVELGPIPKGGVTQKSILWEPIKTDNTIFFVVNDTNPYESDLGNNRASKVITITNFYPGADIQASRLAALTYENISFDGSGSTDQDGSVVGYLFDFGDGTDPGWSDSAMIEHMFEDDGNYTVSLKVKDDKGGESGWATLVVDILNRNPIAMLDVLTTEAERVSLSPVHLSAQGSYDMDGEILNYTWDMGDGWIDGDPQVTVTYETPGKRTIKVRVWDDDNTMADASVVLDVGNLAPVALARTSDMETVFDKGDEVEFDGTGSYDPDGDIDLLIWKFSDGITKRGPAVSRTFKGPGTYNVTLTVTDMLGAEGKDNLTIVIIGHPPTVLLSSNQSSVWTHEPIQFEASANDIDGSIVSYMWDLGDGNTSRSPKPEHAYADDGEYIVTVTVMDDDDLEGKDQLTVKVMNRKPIPRIDANNTLVYVDDDVGFTSKGSIDRDGSIMGRDWDFGDGSTGTGEEVTHSFSSPRTYVVTFTVTDDDGATDLAVITIEVVEREVEPPPPPPDGGDDDERTRALMIVGGVVAVVAMMLVIVVIFIMLGRRRRAMAQGHEAEAGSSPEDPYDDTEPYQDHAEEGHGPGDVDGDMVPEEEYEQ